MSIFESDYHLIKHFENSLKKTHEINSKLVDGNLLSTGILKFHGMSGYMTRILLNNLADIEGLKYAEIGTFTGSTLFSAMFGNKINALCCDNWSQFGGPKETFNRNVRIYSQGSAVDQKLQIIESDFNDLKFGDDPWNDIDFYVFDGPHDRKSQCEGITKAYPGLSDRFILLVDDWNWGDPREGTFDAIKNLGITILKEFSVTTDAEIYDEMGRVSNRFQNSAWHNGIAVFACKKKEIP